MLIMYIPLLIATYIIDDLALLEMVLWIFVILLVSFPISITTFFKNSKLKKSMEHSISSHISYIYSTNLGKLKTGLIFSIFIILVTVFTFPSIFKFNFGSNKPVKEWIVNENVIRNKLYKNLRNNELRIEKAVLSEFVTEKSYVNLFISKYKSDKYHFQKAIEFPAMFSELKEMQLENSVKQTDIYTLYLNDNKLNDITWFTAKDPETEQDGYLTTINLDSLKNGQHLLRIDKFIWSIDNDSLKQVKNWEYIPFQKM